MKRLFLLVLLISLVACKNKTGNDAQEKKRENTGQMAKTETPRGYSSYGKPIDTDHVWDTDKFFKELSSLPAQDTLNIKVRASVEAVCQKKGCWMKLSLPEKQNTLVRFKDYGFFVPKNIKGQQVVVSGKAYVNKMSVKDQRHYAKDEGKSKQEVENITEPKRTYAFMADGVLVKN